MKPRPIRTVRDLEARGLAGDAATAALERVIEKHSLAITPALVENMSPGDALARQFVPHPDELAIAPGELADPIGDQAHAPIKGIVHRYPDRVLLKPIHVCPVYCRFCFRREQVGRDAERLSATELAAALDYIRDREEIWEVVLSGGDPLVLSDRRLGAIVRALNAIPHVQVIRLHTRYPVAVPERITPALARLLRGRAASYVVLHCNHPRELTAAAAAACARLIDRGIPMLSQSVLLKGVNDDAATLEELLRTLVRLRIKPYYLHQLDLARGTGHFRVAIVDGQELMRQLRGRVSGLCQPTYVLDIPGGHGKVPIGPAYLERDGARGSYRVRDHHERTHRYRDPAEGETPGATPRRR